MVFRKSFVILNYTIWNFES